MSGVTQIASLRPARGTNIPPMTETSSETYTWQLRNPWHRWVREQMVRNGWDSQTDLLNHSTLKKSVISRWLDPKIVEKPSVENCRRAAEAFGTLMGHAMIAAGHQTPEEAFPHHVEVAEVPAVKAGPGQLIRELGFQFSEMEADIVSLRAENETLRTALENHGITVHVQQPSRWTHGSRPVAGRGDGPNRQATN